MATLFVELWRLHESQINKLCDVVFRKLWRVPAYEVNAFFDNPKINIDGWRLFSCVFGRSVQSIPGVDADVLARNSSGKNYGLSV